MVCLIFIEQKLQLNSFAWFFENGVPELFEGDIRNDNQIIKWMLDELKQVEYELLAIQ